MSRVHAGQGCCSPTSEIFAVSPLLSRRMFPGCTKKKNVLTLLRSGERKFVLLTDYIRSCRLPILTLLLISATLRPFFLLSASVLWIHAIVNNMFLAGQRADTNNFHVMHHLTSILCTKAACMYGEHGSMDLLCYIQLQVERDTSCIWNPLISHIVKCHTNKQCDL
jgi:hypothetical protein